MNSSQASCEYDCTRFLITVKSIPSRKSSSFLYQWECKIVSAGMTNSSTFVYCNIFYKKSTTSGIISVFLSLFLFPDCQIWLKGLNSFLKYEENSLKQSRLILKLSQVRSEFISISGREELWSFEGQESSVFETFACIWGA